MSPIRYEYMYEKNKSPTAQLDAILRSMASYIVCGDISPSFPSSHLWVSGQLTILQSREIGDKSDPELTPTKLAAFYKAVGGDYDCKLYISCGSPHQQIAFLLISCLFLAHPPCSALCQDGPPKYLMDMAGYRLPAQSPTYDKQLRPSQHTCPNEAWLRSLGSVGDLTRTSRACAFFTICREELGSEAPGDRSTLSSRSSFAGFPTRG